MTSTPWLVLVLLGAALGCSRDNGGTWGCLEARAIELLDRADNAAVLPLWEGLELVKTGGGVEAAAPPPPADASAEDLGSALVSRVARFLGGHVVQLSLPRLDGPQLQRSLEEGRGKMKKMMGHMMMMMGMKMMMLGSLGIAGLFLLAGKALIVSKIALLLSGILALKKLFSQQQDQHHDHHEMVHGWSSGGGGGGGGGGGWGRRAFREQEAAQRLAYRAQRPAVANDV